MIEMDGGIRKSGFLEVFSTVEEPNGRKRSQSEENSWIIVIKWLEEFDFEEEPTEEVVIALKNVERDGWRLVGAYIDVVRRDFFEHGERLLEEDGVESMLKNVEAVKERYERPLGVVKLSAGLFCKFQGAVNALVRQRLTGGLFVEQLEQFFGEKMFSEAAGQFETLLRHCSVLADVGMASTVRYVAAVVTKRRLEQQVRQYGGEWAEGRFFEDNEQFLEAEVVRRLAEVYRASREPFAEGSESVLRTLAEMCSNQLLKLRISELLGIVAAYPRSRGAVAEIRKCLKTEAQRSFLVASFSETLRHTQLHPGANTVDIIKLYIAVIKSFLGIDPTGVLLDKVCRPIRRYLKERSDTIRYVVGGLLDSGGTSELAQLSEELGAAAAAAAADRPEPHRCPGNTELWTPDPIDALPDFKRHRVGDIVECVVSLFDSKAFFINEFLKHFSTQLISAENYNVAGIVAKLNVLKAKFDNSAEFDSLDVMVRDMLESQQLNSAVHGRSAQLAANFHATVVSYLFWPAELMQANKQTTFKPPPQAQQQWLAYQAAFEQIKKGRKIQVLHALGTVRLELELKDRTKEFSVEPHVATVISQFDGANKTLSFAELQKLTEMDETLARNAINYWIKHGILKEYEPDRYKVLEIQDQTAPAQATAESGTFDQQTDEKELDRFKKMSIYLPFINGMLTNFGSMTETKIQSFLMMVVPKELNYSCTESQLVDYLNYLVDEEKLELITGKGYKLKT